MKLMRKELELLYLKKFIKQTDELGGVAYDCGAPDKQLAFYGKVRPLKMAQEVSLNGLMFKAGFVLYTTDSINASLLDCVSSERNGESFVVCGIRKFTDYWEYMLEREDY